MDKKILAHFKKNDPILYKVALASDIGKLRKGDDYYLDLVSSIISQQLSGKAAGTIYDRFLNLFNNKKILPELVLKIPDQKMRKVGISWSKISYIKDLSNQTINGGVDFKTLDKLDDERVIEELTKVKGIGRWTAEMFLMFTLARTDVFSFGDLGLKKGILKLYNFKKEPTSDEILKIVSKWAPYRTYASMIVWKFLDNK